MSTGKHYFIEQTDDGRYAIRAKGSERASEILDTQRAAIDRVTQLNPNDRPDVDDTEWGYAHQMIQQAARIASYDLQKVHAH